MPRGFESRGLASGRNSLDKLLRHADVQDMHAAHIGCGGRHRETDLACDERARLGRANRVPRRLARVAIEPTLGQIDGQFRGRSRVEPIDHLVEQQGAARRGPGAQRRIDNPAAPSIAFPAGRGVIDGAKNFDRHVRLGEDGEVGRPRRRSVRPAGKAIDGRRLGLDANLGTGPGEPRTSSTR